MKRQSLLPNSANGAMLPALLAACAGAAATLQFILPAQEPLTSEVSLARPVTTTLPEIDGKPMPQSLLVATSIFSPQRTVVSSAANSPSGPLKGASLAGMISVRGRAYAIIQTSDQKMIRLAPGMRYANYRLLKFVADGAIFDENGKPVTIHFGNSPVLTHSSTAGQPSPEKEDQ